MRIFISYSFTEGEDLARALTDALEQNDHEVVYPGQSLAPGGDLMSWISTAIRTSDILIALLSGVSPNVHYELGLAAGANVPTLVASRRSEAVVFDLASAPYVQLTGDVSLDVAAVVRSVREVVDVRHDVDRAVPKSPEALVSEVVRDPSVIERLPPEEFERLVAKLFEERGFSVRIAPPTADAGFDLILEGEPLTIVEVKRYRRPNLVSVGTVRELLGSLTAAGAERAILVSSSGFTKAAQAAAANWPVELMTLEDVLRLAAPS